MAKDEIGGYKIDGTLGEGGMGQVYRARDATLERDVAVKVIRAESLTSVGKERFLREARACSRINHPNIITVYAAGEQDGHPYMAMELVAGRTLRDIIKEGPVPWRQAVAWVSDIADALSRLHQEGIIHRDLKPENIMVKEDGLVKLMDFGIAHMASSATLTQEGTSLGTVFYMSPEQASGKKADARSDIFSLAAVLYEALTGEFAFKGEHPMAVMYSITNASPAAIDEFGIEFPEGLREIVERALEKKPEARFADASAFRDELRRLLGGAKPPSPFRLRVVLPAALVLAAAGVVFGVYLRPGGPAKPDREAARTHNETGVQYEQEGRLDDARAEFAKAIQKDPDYAKPWNNLGMLAYRESRTQQTGALRRRKLQEADSLLGKNVKLDPSNAVALYNLGDIRLEMADSTRAITYYTQAIDADATLLHPYNNLGTLLIAKGRVNEAGDYLNDALARKENPKYAEVEPYLLKNRGKVLARLGRPQDALECWQRAVERIPANVELHQLLAASYESSGDKDKARMHWGRVVELTNGEERARALRALENLGLNQNR
ncbi:MAG: protein kinase [Candidatus Krumholzibacteriia bacterium]